MPGPRGPAVCGLVLPLSWAERSGGMQSGALLAGGEQMPSVAVKKVFRDWGARAVTGIGGPIRIFRAEGLSSSSLCLTLGELRLRGDTTFSRSQCFGGTASTGACAFRSPPETHFLHPRCVLFTSALGDQDASYSWMALCQDGDLCPPWTPSDGRRLCRAPYSPAQPALGTSARVSSTPISDGKKHQPKPKPAAPLQPHLGSEGEQDLPAVPLWGASFAREGLAQLSDRTAPCQPQMGRWGGSSGPSPPALPSAPSRSASLE